MKCLVIDSTMDSLIVEVITDNQVFGGSFFESRKSHSELIDGAIIDVLNQSNSTIEQLDSIACSVGPGSFTGIRVGIATIKGINFLKTKKLISFNSFEVLAYNKEGIKDLVIEGKGAFFYAKYDKRVNEVPPMQVEKSFIDGLDNYFTYCDNFDRVSALNELIRAKYSQNDFSENLIPMYLQLSQAEKERLEKINRMENKEKLLKGLTEVELSVFDVDTIRELEVACFLGEAWSNSMIEGEFNFGDCIGVGLRYKGNMIAYGLIQIVLDEGHISTLGVHPIYRGYGVGAILLEKMLTHAYNKGINRFTLEVKASNTTAISLYRKFGFRSLGIRKKYYQDKSDAIVMWNTNYRKIGENESI